MSNFSPSFQNNLFIVCFYNLFLFNFNMGLWVALDFIIVYWFYCWSKFERCFENAVDFSLSILVKYLKFLLVKWITIIFIYFFFYKKNTWWFNLTVVSSVLCWSFNSNSISLIFCSYNIFVAAFFSFLFYDAVKLNS